MKKRKHGPTNIPQEELTKRAASEGAANPDNSPGVKQHAEWLVAELEQNAHNGSYQEWQRYGEEAVKTVSLKGQEFRPFAPFQQSFSAYNTLTRWQLVFLIAMMLGFGFTLLIYGLRAVAVLLSVMILLYISSLLLSFVVSMVALWRPKEEHIDDASIRALFDVEWPAYTILCPLYREAEVVSQFVQAMEVLEYPPDRLQILLLTEEDDVETRAAIEAMHPPRHFSVVTVPAGQPRTKPRACNFGLLQATGEYVVIYDAEDSPEPLQLKKAVLTFANHDADLACVQAKLNYYNAKQNLLTRWFTAEYSLWFDLILPGMQVMKLPLPLGGTSNHFRTELLRRVGAWDPFNVTEDCDLGLRLAHHNLKTSILDSTTYEEANSQVKNWTRQRSRWIKGYLQTYLVYMRHPLRSVRRRGLRGFLSLQLVIGGKTLVLFVNPVMWVLLALYFPLRPFLGEVYQELFPRFTLYLGVICLIAGNFFYYFTLLLGCMKRGHYGVIKWGLFAPIYWAMMSIAAYRALVQLFFKPHYWEKTKHGLHLRASGSPADSPPVKVSPSMNADQESQPFVPESVPEEGAAPAGQAITLPPIADQVQTPSALRGQETLASSLQEAKGVPSVNGSQARQRRNIAVARVLGRNIQPSAKAEGGQDRRDPSAPLIEAPPSARIPTSRRMRLEQPVDKTGALDRSAIQSLAIMPMPGPRSERRPFLRRSERPARQPWFKDRWLVATILIACAASITSCWYYFQQDQLLLYSDAISHLRIAREIVDSTTPGLAQLGGVWLPLPHLLMLPFIWNDSLWRSGLAGSFPSMVGYLVAVIYLFRSARRLTQDSSASFVGTLLFILNPNILYLQSTPMNESLCVATTVMACYYFLAWTQDDDPKNLVGMAAGTFLATLTRYDGWGLFLVLLVLLVIVGVLKRHRWVQIEGTLLVYGSLGGFGIGLWVLWCGLIFGDPFYFHHYLFEFAAESRFYTYLNPWQAIGAYLFLSVQTVGPLLFALAGIALVTFVFRVRLTPPLLGGAAFLTPFVFYMLIFFSGQDTVDLPGFSPPNSPFDLWNVRFGVETIAPVALFFALLARRWSIPKLASLWNFLRQPVLILLIGIQTVFIASGGILSLQDGLYGASCQPTQPITMYLVQHYSGGKILEDVNDYRIEEADIGIDLTDVIYEGSGELWTKALSDPASLVEWIIVPSTINNDPIASHIDLESATFLSQFTLVLQQGNADPVGLRLYHRNGGPPLPTRPVPADFLTEHSLCPGRSPGPHTSLPSHPFSVATEGIGKTPTGS